MGHQRARRPHPRQQQIPDYFQQVYARLETHSDSDFLFLGGMTEKTNEKVYVDDVHYNELMNEQIADKIAQRIHIGGSR